MAVYRAHTANFKLFLNPLNAKLNPICHFLALLGAQPILHVSRIRVNRLDGIIKTLYKVDLKLTIRGDINIDYLTDNDKKDNLMQRFSLTIYQLWYISPLHLKVIPTLQYILYTGC